MNRFYALAVSICIPLLLTINGNAQNSSTQAAKQAGSDKRIIEQMFAGWNSRDANKVAAVFSEDAVYEDVTADHISRGRTEVREWAAGAFVVFENFKMEVVSSSFHDGSGFVEWIWSGTDKGIHKTGKNFSVRGVSIVEIRKGKIHRYKEFYDWSTAMKQLGLLPAEKE
ncbi:MAG: nuclear transport factor 2 family protein [bacterium]|nr:nuclear transport factor 2 family protein [bacterium]